LRARQRTLYLGDQFDLLISRRDHESSERVFVAEPHIDEDPLRVVVKVQEGFGPTIEDARALLDQSVDGPKLFEERGQTQQGLVRSVSYRSECSPGRIYVRRTMSSTCNARNSSNDGVVLKLKT
jgi:hypothetical protein